MTFAAMFCSVLFSDLLSSFALSKSNLDIAKADDIAIFDLSRLAIRYAPPIYIGTVCRSRVGDEQSALLVHCECSMNLGNTCVIQTELIVRHATNAQPPAS